MSIQRGHARREQALEPGARGQRRVGAVVPHDELVEIIGIGLRLQTFGPRGRAFVSQPASGTVEIGAGRRIGQEPGGEDQSHRAQAPADKILHGAIRFPRRYDRRTLGYHFNTCHAL